MREAGRNVRGLGVFRLVKRCVAPFVFFFFFEFRPDSAVSVDTGRYGRYGPSRPDFGRVGADFCRIGVDFSRVGPIRDLPRGMTRSDAARMRGLRRPCRVPASRRVGRECVGLGAASVHPRWRACFGGVWEVVF